MKNQLIKLLSLVIIGCTSVSAFSQITERETPKKWDNLIKGAQFMDRFLPMEGHKICSKNAWGADCVKNRYADNGFELSNWSIWGGKVIKDEKGLYHLFTCGWIENSPKGHMEWSNSMLFHAVSKKISGPYVNKGIIGKGHNPEIYKTASGEYVIYVIDGYYKSNSLDGPWIYGKFNFDNRGRRIIEGLSNLTFAQREDGSYLMICRGGGVWISKDGLKSYKQISDHRVYPNVNGAFEDPVIWRDSIQYNLIVNDWYGRIAFYLRSKDGVKWVVEDGRAYVPGIARHKDGTVEDWFKYERMRVFQDKEGRAMYSNFAVCDTLKFEDHPNDKYSAKNIFIPLNPGMLVTIKNNDVITKNTNKIVAFIKSEKGFNAVKDIDYSSLIIGSYKDVNYGRGLKVTNVTAQKGGALVTFEGDNSTFTDDDDFALKVIGKRKNGEMLFAYAKVPSIKFIEPIISSQIVKLEGNKCVLKVENFGQVKSLPVVLEIYSLNNDSKELVGKANVSALEPYTTQNVTLDCINGFEKDKECQFQIMVKQDNKTIRVETLKVINK